MGRLLQVNKAAEQGQVGDPAAGVRTGSIIIP
jgi:hypothetical protein